MFEMAAGVAAARSDQQRSRDYAISILYLLKIEDSNDAFGH
jgi:hypothetical protein